MLRKNFDFVVVGAVGIDTNIYLYNDEIDFSVEMNFSQNHDNVGQAGGYSSRILAALGYKVAFAGFVGDDMGGLEIRRTFTKEEIDTTHLFIDRTGTKRSVNIVYTDGRRKNFYDGKGSSETSLNPDDYEELFRSSKVAHFSIVDWARHLLPVARRTGCIVACDLQDIVSFDDEYRKDFINSADILFFSSVNNANPVESVKRLLQQRTDAMVLCGCGSKGCILGSKEKIQTFEVIQEGLPVIDTNGCGDSLAMGFLAGLSQGYSPEKAVHCGQVLARHCCTFRGAKRECFMDEDTFISASCRH